MIRFLGVNIADNKNLEIGLSYLYGVGRPLAIKIAQMANLDPLTKISQLKNEELERLREIIERNFKVEGDLRLEVSQNIRRLKEISAYRGQRHAKNLPVRGQHTRTNARTKRGKRVTVGSGRKKSAEKT
ncbi:30S ribosomal protein S13 [Candidatus Berkelbacteria bacterium]|nr:30S ribosomal protein S13 [Candidatus Berkelbacteria bacterium]MBI2588179.1 30S ribosomal protein S13 [Candidatus Berkelbacteria bacterium]MBI4029937.1 30S ribosomal protein S13 [Candidatus Berkelbacteria bacterium]